EPLAGELARLLRQAGDVAARPVEARDQPDADRIARDREYDGDHRCHLSCRGDGEPRRHDDIDLEPDELRSDLGEALALSVRPAHFDRDGAALGPAELIEPLHERSGPWAPA